MSGPIRPNMNQVIFNLKELKKNIDDSRVFFSTWGEKNENTFIELNKYVDYLFVNNEPSDDFILERTRSTIPNGDKTIQYRQLNLPPNVNIFRMFLGKKYIFDFVEKNNILQPNDLCVRTRTDILIIFKKDSDCFLKNMDISDKYYTNYWGGSGVGITDWFAISSYKNIKNIWYYPSLDELNSEYLKKYNNDVYNSWNPESIIKNNIIKNNLKILDISNLLETIKLDDNRK